MNFIFQAHFYKRAIFAISLLLSCFKKSLNVSISQPHPSLALLVPPSPMGKVTLGFASLRLLPKVGAYDNPSPLRGAPLTQGSQRTQPSPLGKGDHEVVDEVKSLPCVKGGGPLVVEGLLYLIHHLPRGKVEGASLREGGAEQSEAEGERVSLFIYRRLFRTLNSTQAPSVTFGATSLSEGGLDYPLTATRSCLACGRVTMKSDKSDEITK